ncbi:bifunctional tetrahydrofolate synthase/dihydrofolate synthase [Legionella micdadei]|uniref:Dihydrofolate synthase/folylpolyglutamate synthase n=1 Tax=Legionella micdadei TaxID=451 RepID=A0A098GFT2_LEGMI|nr:bifunctional tetrahydrofolate synthase/dihydrofolate synthase [Legionella micdadei]ARG97589.1 bifunctional tetrahydrofolate synthase/dihydrofolate synthase [Legionella micdadei]ARH00099.1 bifunctional tetrahydrofolate synthase/dihydrofolate synthase [Legionella micdadei]KTD27669.1 dihydrofolate:folylpolyglutamate synthetase FolC [Legionella micdadei]NSL17653.1 bifunctional tetrahydrofolate synthase/dihydrofolate synthase [Legionella micdadei]CEG60845.1 Bifunctional protein folC [Includes: F
MKQYKNFTLAEWLDFLENRHQQEIQLDLSRVQQVAKTLDLLQPKAKVITVAGTNGKGSTVATLETIYLEAGYQVASYTSPHLLMFNERIRVNKKNISDEQLCHAFSAIEAGRGDIPLTYFEVATLAALWHFKQRQLDLIILEVGLGGRLDATNIIAADLAIITTIDLDHQEYLGNTREAIGFEKAGILRANRPFIFADQNPPQSIIDQGLALNAPMYLSERDYNFRLINQTIELKFQGEYLVFPQPKLHCNSVVAAIVASLLLKAKLPISYSHLQQAIAYVFLPGRLQLIKDKMTTLLDVSHNPQAVNYLADFVRNFSPRKKVHAVFSALKDKDIRGMVASLKDCVDYWYPALLNGKRAASRQQLEDALSLCSNTPICHNDPLAAYQAACNSANEGDLIVVYGSFITVSKVMQAIYEKQGSVDKQLEESLSS